MGIRLLDAISYVDLLVHFCHWFELKSNDCVEARRGTAARGRKPNGQKLLINNGILLGTASCQLSPLLQN